MRTLTVVVVVVALSAATVLACGSATPASSPAGETIQVATDAPEPASAIELVRVLEAIATGARPGTLDEHVDAEFAARLPSGDDLADLFRGYPEGCRPELSEGPGYGLIAIPPPMEDDGEEEAARTEAIIEELEASTEVIASCTVVELADEGEEGGEEEYEREVVLWAIAVRRGEDGRFRALAWRDLRSERPAH